MKVYAEQISGKADEKQRLADGSWTNYGSLQTPVHRKWTSYKVEPVLFMALVAVRLSDQVVTNLLESRACLVTQRLDVTNCTEPLSETVEDLVQPGTATIITARTLIEGFLPAFLTLLVGPWSDQNGRKPFLTIAIAGHVLSSFIWTVLSLIPTLEPEVFLLASAPLALSGGFSSILLLCYCYISDVTDEYNRAPRLALLCLAYPVGMVIGLSGASLLISLQGDTINPYPPIFFLSTCLLLLTTLYTHNCLQETVQIHPNREKRLLVFTHVKSLFSTYFKRRESHDRAIILLLVWTLTILVATMAGEGSTTYLSVREMFSWQLSDYSAFMSFNCVLSGLGALVGVPLLVSWFSLSNLAAGIVVLSLNTLHSIINALASNGSIFYLASAVNFFGSVIIPLCRAELSLLVPKDDLGKVFALTAFLESILPMASTPLYTLVYKATFLTYTRTIYWLSAALGALCVLLLLIAFILKKTSQRTP